MAAFKVAQAKAARGERQRQESQSHVANLATLFLDLAALQTPFGNSKATLDKIRDFFYSVGKRWRWQRCILATKRCENMSPVRVLNEQQRLRRSLPSV